MIDCIGRYAVCLAFIATACGCSDDKPAAMPNKIEPPAVLEKVPINEEEVVGQIRNEMEELRLQRTEAEQEKARLQQEVQQIQQAINSVDENTDRIQNKIDELEYQ